MREIKFSCMWYDGASWMDLRYTQEELENGDHWDALADLPPLKKFKLKHKRQFTGLADKNGVEIYEGDILKASDYVRTVEFLDGAWMTKRLNGYQALNSITIGGYEYEVIGNIHENPELLEDAR